MMEQSEPKRPISGMSPKMLTDYLQPVGDDISPIVDTFSLETTLTPRLVETVDWFYERNGIRDPEETIANQVRNRDDVGYKGFMADLLAYASTWAYADPATFAFMMSHRGLKRWRYFYMRLGNDPLFVVSSAYLMQSYTGDVCILVFRGTDPTNVPNWLTDLTISPERFLEGEVHGGILRNLMAIWPMVSMGLFTVEKQRNLFLLPMRKLSDDEDTVDHHAAAAEDLSEKFYANSYEERCFDDPRKKVRPLKALYITGHSLGGGMAALATAQIDKTPSWREVRDNLFGCYTYGAPMVASPVLAKQLDKDIGDLSYRHVYANDVVPQLPPASTGKFQHFGHEYRCLSNGRGWLNTDHPVLQTPYVSLLPLAGLGIVFEQFPALRRLANVLPISLDHHSPRHYMRVSEQSRTAMF
jgi:Lipase (class 3)